MDAPPETLDPIKPLQSRYIKFGQNGMWEEECIEKGIARIGFGTGKPEVFKHCCNGEWEWVKSCQLKRGKPAREATSISNQLRQFFEDEGQTLWITFCNKRLFWAFLKDSKADMHSDGEGAFRRVKDRWQDHDMSNGELTLDKLPEFLTKLRFFPATSCGVHRLADAVSRINGKKPIEV